MNFSYLISDSGRLLRREFGCRVRSLGVTSPQARLLMIVSHAEGERQKFYAERLDVEPISLSRLVDRLNNAGLIERRPDASDRRAWRMYLTAKGRHLVTSIEICLDTLEQDMLRNIDAGDRDSLDRILGAIRDNLHIAG
jgi:MarR family transcriptional regulator for hemolysin